MLPPTKKTSSLLQIEVEKVISLFDSVANDDIVSNRWSRDLETGKETFILSRTLPTDSSFMRDFPEISSTQQNE